VKPGRYIVLGALVIGGAMFGYKQYKARHATRSIVAGAPAQQKYDEEAFNTRAPDSSRITIEVINATKVRGLGRKATTYLRDRGFDVVFVTTSKVEMKETKVLDRSGHPERAALVAKALHARSEPRPDTTRYVDATVLIGYDWTPPPLPFYP
jgi:hypothetical protein